jgi:hypothetical protein
MTLVAVRSRLKGHASRSVGAPLGDTIRRLMKEHRS